MIQDPNNGTETITSGLDRRMALKAALGGAAAAAVVAGPAVNGLGVLPAYAQTSSPPPGGWSGSNSGSSVACVQPQGQSIACCWGVHNNPPASPRCTSASFALATGLGPVLTVTRDRAVRNQASGSIGQATLAMAGLPGGGLTSCTTTLSVSCSSGSPTPAAPVNDTFPAGNVTRTISCGTGASSSVIGTLTVSMTCT